MEAPRPAVAADGAAWHRRGGSFAAEGALMLTCSCQPAAAVRCGSRVASSAVGIPEIKFRSFEELSAEMVEADVALMKRNPLPWTCAAGLCMTTGITVIQPGNGHYFEAPGIDIITPRSGER